ncbi:MAG: polyprenyl synthetase family protein [bacterium]
MTTPASNMMTELMVITETIDRLLLDYLPSTEAEPKMLHEAMRYSVVAGGKRLRPILAMSAYEFAGGVATGDDPAIHHAMAALEMVHTYSLIHDDLPCMDDDDLRRGQPTCHRKFGGDTDSARKRGQAIAVLAGDALHVMAFDLMARTGSIEAVRLLAHAVGTQGMIGGQMADMAAEGREVSRSEVENIHRRKTAALIQCSVLIGAILADADDAMRARLSVYGENIGLAFQIVDDILDIEGDQDLLGKRVGSDTRNKKATYPAVVGSEQARADVERLIDEAVAELGDDPHGKLTFIARYIRDRNR